MDVFRPECKRLLSPVLYKQNLWDGGENPLEEAIASFCLERPLKVFLAGCDKCSCRMDEGGSGLECVECGAKRCMQCFGMEMSKSRNQRYSGVRKYRCEWCLEKHKCDCEHCVPNQPNKDHCKPCKNLLQPDIGVMMCSCCGCDLNDANWAAFPARCRHCRRLFCEKEVATCVLDVDQASSSAALAVISVLGASRFCKAESLSSGVWSAKCFRVSVIHST